MASLIVAGSTGAIGRAVVQHALRQPTITKVVALTRQADLTPAGFMKAIGVDAEAVDPTHIAKLHPTTFNWEDFSHFWAAYATAVRDEKAGQQLPEPVAKDLERYKDIFFGHTYAAMCLGTTRADAGSAKNFTRCDYDFVVGFTEAVLTFSAPCGFSPTEAAGLLSAEEPKSSRGTTDDGFVYHIGDGTKGAEVVDRQRADKVDAAALQARSSRTLRVIGSVSASNADKNGWLLYTKTKGCADAAMIERITAHNRWARAQSPDGSSLIKFSVVQPGLLDRGEVKRTNEKLASFILSSIKVDVCGASIVSDFVHHDHSDADKAKKSWEGECAAPLMAKPKGSAEAVREPIFIYQNKHIKKQAATLNSGM